MATLNERSGLVADLQPRLRMALCAEIYAIMRTTPSGNEDAQKALRIKQRWAGQALLRLDYWTRIIADLIAGAAPDAALTDGELSDAEIETYVPLAIEVCASVEYAKPTETLPGA